MSLYIVGCIVFIISFALLLAARRTSIVLILLSTIFYCYMSLRSELNR